MDCRRGLLLAGINLTVALPMICILTSEDAQARRDWKEKSAIEETHWIDSAGDFSAAPTQVVQVQEEQAVSFSPCGMWSHYPPQTYVVQLGNLPAFVMTQWREACPAKWSIARMLGVNDGWLISDDNFKAMRRVVVALCLMIAIQWFLIGSFPLIQSDRWRGEPGAFITTCNALAACIAIIPAVDGLARLPALIAFFGWLWWFGLLLWIPARKAWQTTLGGLRRLTH